MLLSCIIYLYSGTIGTTATTAVDNIFELGELCNTEKMFLHVDAAYAGSFLYV
jgi:glutamate/tyrosine decarboxylase-like PLP-dependent enzyme